MANHSFNLVTEPWVPVLANGKHESYSLETLFDQPTSIRQLDIADPLGRVSIMRLLLAIMYAARQEGYSSPAEAKRIMEAGRDQEIIDYLHAWAHRFDLMSETEPFLQVAGMMPQGKPKDYGFTRLHPAMQRPLWQTHDPYKPVTPAEAARMLLVCNMYDVAGVHTGMNGDPKAAGGKRTPQGVAQAGGLALAIITGNNLWETLLLNLTPADNGNKPIWEYPSLKCTDMEPDTTGPAYYYTYPARRIRLLWNTNGLCAGAYVTYGNRSEWASPENEPMSFWTQDATGKPKPVNLTFGPLIDRPLWTQWDKAFVGSDGDEHYPATFLWASRLNPIISFDVIAVQYGSQSSSIARIRQDHMTLDMRRIQEHEKISGIVDNLVKQAWPKVSNNDNPYDTWAKTDALILPYLAGGKEPDLD